MPETSYAPCGDLSLAYQVFVDGHVELVFSGSFASHIELYWTIPEFVAFFERLSTFCRVLLFDKAGSGLSDPVPKVSHAGRSGGRDRSRHGRRRLQKSGAFRA